jgi:hypothetical protein
MKRHNVVIPKADGGVELYPMKAWLRQNPEHIPNGLDPSFNTSHRLRDALRRKGWSIQEIPTEVRLVMPGHAGLETAIGAVLGEESETDLEESEAAFALEFQLRDFIAHNRSTIRVGGRRLRLYRDSDGREGIEFPTAVGPIDILAVDEDGTFVVFELKRARSPDRAIGQLSRYMGWVKQTLAKGKSVRGVIVAKEISENLRYAVSVIPGVTLFEYVVSFQLKAAHEIQGGEE